MLNSNSFSEGEQHYLPTLLQRLQDDEPKSQHDRARLIDIKTMRSMVQKDIVDLLNHTNIENRLNESQHKLIMGSVINYGVSPLIGTLEFHKNWSEIEKALRNTILRFEPRIIPETLLVRSLQQQEGTARYAVILFEIRGLVHWRTGPFDLCLNGRYDFESEKVDLALL